MSKFDLFSLTECFKRISSEWGLELIEIDTGNHVSKAFTISVITLGTVASACVLASLLLEDHIVVNATLGADSRTVTLDMNDYTATPTDLGVIERRIVSKLVATIFAPLFRPNKECQNLSQLSVIAAINGMLYIFFCLNSQNQSSQYPFVSRPIVLSVGHRTMPACPNKPIL